MLNLNHYSQFDGRHWETGTVHNHLAHRGFVAPHTGEPYSEALLMGVSGGAVFGYFSFAYEGFDPMCNLLTRNTFDPLDTMLSRLGITQDLKQTRQANRAVSNLVDMLEDGVPAIVWADLWSLPYNGLEHDEGMWGAFPIIVFGYDADANQVRIADRAAVPLSVTTEELAAARGRIKKIRFRIMSLDAPDPDKLASAVQLGIHDTIRLYTEKPPKGSRDSFGLRAFEHWAKLLTQPKQRNSWAKVFPAGINMFAGLTSAYEFAFLFGKDTAQDAERGLYAAFLDEAAAILNRPALRETAVLFRSCAELWHQFPAILLPDDVEPFRQARQLKFRRHTMFLEKGIGAGDEMRQIDGQLATIRQEMAVAFPWTQSQVEAHWERMAEHINRLHDAEAAAVRSLQSALI